MQRKKMHWSRFYTATRNLVASTANVHWYDYQRDVAQRIIKAVVEKEATEIVIMYPRQCGKSEVIADICFGLMMLAPDVYPDEWGHGFKIGVFAPKYDLSQIIYSRIRKLFHPEILSMLGMGVTQSNGDTHTLTNGSFTRCMTANTKTSKEGHTLDLAIIDEAQDVDQDVLLKSIWPMTTATAGTRVMIGTATTVKRYFYDVQQRLDGTDRCFVIDVEQVMEDRRKMYDATKKQWHLNYEKDFTKQLSERGKDDYIRMAYYLEWILERGMFITDDQLARGGLPYDPINKWDHECYVGLDFGKEGDSTVMTIEALECPVNCTITLPDGTKKEVNAGERVWDHERQRYHSFILNWFEWVGDRYTDQMRDAIGILRKRYPKVKNVTYDETGVGKGVEDILYDEAREQWPDLIDKINGFSFAGSAQQLNDLWENLQRVMVNHPIRHWPAGTAFWPSDSIRKFMAIHDERGSFVKQFTDLEKVWRGPYLKCAVPEGGNRHDDYCASSALANWGIENFAGTRIEVVPLSINQETGEESEEGLTLDGLFNDGPSIGDSGAYYM